ncbi:MAG: TatD family hydrolase [Bacteroidota bacterium]|nr:TatD family hydrolase [Bacteroidota bacterium]
MNFIDTHTHLYSEEFDADRHEMIQRAIDLGIKHLYLPAIDSNYIESMYDLEAKYPEQISLMCGLHPTYVKQNYLSELETIENQLKVRKFAAIGEIGIDLYWDKTFVKEQKECFAHQIRLANHYDLPIVIHCRDAFDEVFEVLEQENNGHLRGIFHCFTGSYYDALKAISFNLKLGIGGVVTFKNGKIDQFLNQIELKHIVLETDAPYLAPVPYRGKRNESAYLIHTAQKLADIYQLPLDKIAEVTTNNAKEIFANYK